MRSGVCVSGHVNNTTMYYECSLVFFPSLSVRMRNNMEVRKFETGH